MSLVSDLRRPLNVLMTCLYAGEMSSMRSSRLCKRPWVTRVFVGKTNRMPDEVDEMLKFGNPYQCTHVAIDVLLFCVYSEYLCCRSMTPEVSGKE